MAQDIANYTIKQKISENNNSLVYRATRTEDQLPVILKLPKAEYPTAKQILHYQREYHLTNQIHLEGVIKSYELQKKQRQPVLVLEDFGGESLKYWAKHRDFTILQVLEIAIKIIDIVGKIHRKDIIHKDLNTSNIVYNPDTEQLKLIDFGIATVLSRQNPNLSSPEVLEGTLTHISPEQTGRMNRPLDYRTDFYSFGVSLYQLLTKQLPFTSSEPIKLIHCHLAKQPRPPQELNPKIPPALNNIVMKLLVKNVESRYQSAVGIRADLERCLVELVRGQTPDFPLATADRADRVPISQQLYDLATETHAQTDDTDFEAEDLFTGTINTSTGSSIAEILDMGAVLKAAKAIGAEIELDKLLITFMRILLESAGAQTGYLLLESEGQWLIEAAGVGEEVEVLQSLPLGGLMPESIVNHVLQTRKNVVENNACVQGNFTQDSYIQRRQVKSLLCAPLIHQGKIMGLIYLENSLARGIFDNQRLAILKVLSSQAVMSITNAKLFLELKKRENQLKQFLDAMPIGVSVHDPQGNVSYINPIGQVLTQHEQVVARQNLETPNEISEAYQIYQTGTEQLYPQDELPLIRALQGESVVADDLELHYLGNDPAELRVVPIEIHSTPIFDEQGRVIYAINTFMDISQRKQAEKILMDYSYTLEQQVAERTAELEAEIVGHQRTEFALRQSEAQNRAILQAIPDLMFRVSGAGVYLGYARSSGLVDLIADQEAIVGKHMTEYLPPDIYQRQMHYLTQALATNAVQSYEQEVVLASKIQYEEVRVVPVEGKDEVLFMIRDVSDRKRAEFALAASEAQNRAIVQSIPDIMFRVSNDGVYLGFVTSTTMQNLVAEGENPVGKTMAELGVYAPPKVLERQLHHMELAIATGKIQIYEQELNIQGLVQHEEVRVVPIEDQGEVLFIIRDISDRKQAELALAASEAQNRAILQAIPDLMFRLSAQEIYLGFVTSSNLRSWMPENGHYIGQHLQEGIPPEVYQRHRQHLYLALETRKAQIYEQEVSVEGRIQQEEVRVVPIEDTDEALFMIRDVSDRKRAERALAESEAKNRAILQAIPDIMFRVDAQGTYLGFVTSSKLQNLVNQTNQVVGKTMEELAVDTPPEVHQRHLHHLQLALKTRKTQIYEQELIVGGQVQQEEVRAVPIEDKEEVLFMIRDISDRKQAEVALKQRNDELANTLAELQQTQHELIQSEKMAALGQLVAGVAHEINNPLGAISSSVENISDFFSRTLTELPNFFKNLSLPEQEAFFTLLQHTATQHRNLSSKEKRQLRRALTKELEALGIEDGDSIADTLVDIGVHDQLEIFLPIFQSPNRSEILKVAYQLATLKTSSDTIKMASSRAAKIVFALKNYARYDQSGNKSPANIVDGIETVLTLYQNQIKQGVEIIRNYPSEIPVILCYPDELNQVWTNLVHNALQAMNNRGILTITVQLQKKHICVEITDSGQGIPPEILPQIFEPFFTTKPTGEGSGLGLNIVRKIIDKHDGTISVRSVPTVTTFTIYIPLILPTALPRATEQAIDRSTDSTPEPTYDQLLQQYPDSTVN